MRYGDALALQELAAALATDAGDLTAARAWLEAHDRWTAWGDTVLGRAEGQLGWATYYRAEGDADRASAHAQDALAHASDPRQPLTLLAAHRLLGELATDARRFGDAETHLGEALAVADACTAPYERAQTQLAMAALRAQTGETDRAQSLLVEAHATFAALGAGPALARTDLLASGLASAPMPHRPAYPAGLSAREVEVLRLLAAGLANRAIAERLFIGERTVETHTRAIYNKIGVSSRTAATRFAIEHDLA
jgi:DNA-binding CsgD family transcriptional regulator